MKMTIEARLSDLAAIQETTASTATGNILIRFNSGNNHQSIAILIADVLKDVFPETPKTETQTTIKTGAGPNEPATKAVRVDHRVLKKVKSVFNPYQAQEEKDWHIINGQEGIELLSSDAQQGLSGDVARQRLDLYGYNRLPEPKARSHWDIFTGQFLSLPVGLLGAAAAVSILTGGLLDAVVIMGVVIANGMIGYYTESEAERTINSLKSYVKPHARVIRDGTHLDISAEEIVPGDLVILNPGFYVPADCRIMAATHLSIDESALTGESMPVYKESRSLEIHNLPLADRVNMAYMGTLVTGGEGLALTVATGKYTEFGKLQLLLGETSSPETPIEKQLGKMGDQLVIACGVICGVVFIIGFLRGYGILEMLRTSISLAAAAVPEGLPAAATINFALGITNMRKHNVLVRNLQSIETLGAVQTVCLDKTGTITYNRMTLVQIVTDEYRIDVIDHRCQLDDSPSAHDSLRKLLQVCVLCSDVRLEKNAAEPDGYELIGSPTEKTLVKAALNANLDINTLRNQYPLIKVENRAENRLYMSTQHQSLIDNKKFFAVKGSPAEVLDMCRYRLMHGMVIALTEEERVQIETENERMSSDALRVLGVAYAEDDGLSPFNPQEDLIWLGLAGMVDPIREGVADLIRVYHQAGIETIMITGDQSPTAYAVAKELNLNRGDQPILLDSTELIGMDNEVMEALAKRVNVYSRVSPSHKLKIVQALQSIGRVVAMTGDGVNDSPALKAADIGIAMGKTGTDVAREVADVVLQDDNMETLIIAVRDGRTTYNNIRKSLRFFLATNMSEVMIMFASLSAGVGAPLSVMQLLWINIISDILPGLSLSMEAPEGDVLSLPPRDSQASILSKADFKRMAKESAIITAGALGAYGYGIFKYGRGSLGAGSLAFQSLTLGQLLHAISCRSEHTSVLNRQNLPSNPYFNGAIWGSVLLQGLTMVIPPLRNFLGVITPSLADVGMIAATSVIPLVINELTKKTGGFK